MPTGVPYQKIRGSTFQFQHVGRSDEIQYGRHGAQCAQITKNGNKLLISLKLKIQKWLMPR